MKAAGFSANIITRLKRNRYISLESIESICRVMDCRVDDMLEFTEGQE
jgi:DNA-binding Xre family transcriptional regulator